MKKVMVLFIGLVCTICFFSTAFGQTVRSYAKPDGSSVTVKASKGMSVTDQDLQAIADLDRKDAAKKAEQNAYLVKQEAEAAAEEIDPQKRFRDRYVERAYTTELARQAEYDRRSLARSEREELVNNRMRSTGAAYSERTTITGPSGRTTTIDREASISRR